MFGTSIPGQANKKLPSFLSFYQQAFYEQLNIWQLRQMLVLSNYIGVVCAYAVDFQKWRRYDISQLRTALHHHL